MNQTLETAQTFLRQLGEPSELAEAARQGRIWTGDGAVNAHVHLPPNFSAFNRVDEALDQARRENLIALGASNYYEYEVYGLFAQAARERGVFPLFGMEILAMDPELRERGWRINDPGNPGKCYVCGKALVRLSAMPAEARRRLEQIRLADSARIRQMIRRLEEIFTARGLVTGLDEAAVIDRVVQRHNCPRSWVCLQERHVAQAFQERFFELVAPESRRRVLTRLLEAEPRIQGPEDAVGVQEEIRTYLMKHGRPAFVPEPFIELDQAIQLVHQLGGVAVYPLVLDAMEPMSELERDLDRLVEWVRRRGFQGVEVITVRNQLPVVRRYIQAFDQAGFIATAGTEHNTLKRLSLVPAFRDGSAIPGDLERIFRRGVCVLVAHQFLGLHGQVGYDGPVPQNAGEVSAWKERMEALANLGAAVLERYRQACREKDVAVRPIGS